MRYQTAEGGLDKCYTAGMLNNRRVVITGASRGVGYQIVRRFLADGAQVLGVGRNPKNLHKVDREFRSYGKLWSCVRADVGTPAGARKIAQAAKRRWSAVDLLINNAGISPGHPSFATETDDALETTLATNLLGPHRIIRALLPLLRKGKHPRVVNVSSGAGSEGSISTGTNMSSYRLSKWCLNGLTRLWANELKGKISVIAMDPGWVKTDMGGPQAPDSPLLSAKRAAEIAELPFKITGTYQAGKHRGGW